MTGAPLARVLVTEDDPVTQRVVGAMLDHLGFQADVASDGAEAVTAAGTNGYRAILMDCQIPVIDGYQATLQIRSLQGPGARTPIIAVSASATEHVRERCLAAGMDDFLAKPLSLQTLGSALARWGPGGSGRANAGHKPLSGLNPDPALAGDDGPPVLNDRVVSRLERLGDDAGEDLMGQLATLFLAAADDRMVALRRALESGDIGELARLAHLLRGAGVNVGADQLARACDILEADAASRDLAGAEVLLDAVAAELARTRVALTERLPA